MAPALFPGARRHPPASLRAAALAGLACAVLALLLPGAGLAQSPPQPVQPPQAAPVPQPPRPEVQPLPQAPVPPSASEDEEEDDERADGVQPGEGCPYRGNKLELIV